MTVMSRRPCTASAKSTGHVTSCNRSCDITNIDGRVININDCVSHLARLHLPLTNERVADRLPDQILLQLSRKTSVTRQKVEVRLAGMLTAGCGL